MPTTTRVRPRSRTSAPTILQVEDLVVTAPGGARIIDGVTFAVPRGALVAVVGPTGAGKSTLLNALTGALVPASGRIILDGDVVSHDDDAARRRIGYVPQHDAVHAGLSLRRMLSYSAELRLPVSVGSAERDRRVADVLAELGLSAQADLPVAALSGGQRKRASVAVELIARPDVLILDEPTSGLDPGYEKSVLRTLRTIADSGRTVLTVTHSLQALAICDLALFLAPGGHVAFFGTPAEARRYFGFRDAADVFLALESQPGTVWEARFRELVAPPVVVPSNHAGSPDVPPVRRSPSQLRVLMTRYLDLIRSDRRQLMMLLCQGPILGVLLWAVLSPGALRPHTANPDAVTAIVFVIISVTWVGAANAVREIVKEQHILQREQAGGLSIGAYVASKAGVLGLITMVQAGILTAVALSRSDPPAHGAVLASGLAELVIAAALTTLAAVALGLLVSAIVSTPDKAMSALPVVLVAQLVLSGGWVSVLSTPVLHQLADVTAARWGVQAFQATETANRHAWWAAVFALVALTAVCLVCAALITYRRLHPGTSGVTVRETRAAALSGAIALGCILIGAGIGGASPIHAVADVDAAHEVALGVPHSKTLAAAAHTTVTVRAPRVVNKPLKTAVTSSAHSTTASTTASTTSPPVTVAPTTPKPAADSTPVAAPTPTTTPTTTPPTTVAPSTSANANQWASVASMAYQWWLASQGSATSK